MQTPRGRPLALPLFRAGMARRRVVRALCPCTLRARRGRGAWAQAPLGLCGRQAHRKQPRAGDADAAGGWVSYTTYIYLFKGTTSPNGRLPGATGCAPGPRPQRARCRARAAPGAMGGGRGRPKKEDAGARGPGPPPRPGKCNPCFYVQRDGKPRRDTVPPAELRRRPAARPQLTSLSGRGGCPQ